ncbi:MAG TPA: HNH endonuclease [Polyangia bacterium]|jgi:hypothetical protein
MPTPSPTITRLEKAAVDNGFDRKLTPQGNWIALASTHAPLRIWLTADDEGHPVAALSQLNVVRALGDHGTQAHVQLPPDALGARSVADVPSLHRLLRRAFQLSRTLPHELLQAYERRTATLPRTTEAERLVVQRVGQDVFRQGLLEYWEGRCAITGLAVPELLRASHIKPWADCETDAERLDVFNGLLLAPQLDAAFDQGFITVTQDGEILVSSRLASTDRTLLGLIPGLRVVGLADGHRGYLPWHRERVFKPSR